MWIWAATAAAALAALGWAFAPRPVNVEAGSAARGRFEQAIEEDGRTRLLDRFAVSAPVAGRIARIALREGDAVAPNDVVAWISPLSPQLVDERAAREAAARLKAAEAGVLAAQARADRARLGLQEARLERQRTERLAGEGFLSASRLDSARIAFAAAGRELEVAQAQREAAEQERAQAAAALQPVGAQPRTGQLLAVRAPAAGRVLKVVQPSETAVAVGSVLVEIGDPARMEVVAELLTADAVQAQPGVPAVMERWGGPPVQGRVRRVEPAAFTKISALGIEEQRVNVLIEFGTPPAAWSAVGDGFRVGVRIITRSEPDALLVPVGAVFPHGTGTAVYRIEGRRARLVEVQVLARNGNHAWLGAGLSPGDRVVLYPPAGLADGARIKPLDADRPA